MPEVSLLLALALMVVAAIVVFRIVSSIVKTVLIMGAVLAIMVAIAGGLVVLDAYKLKEKLQSGDSLLLVAGRDWAAVTSGVLMNGQDFEVLSKPELDVVNSELGKSGYPGLPNALPGKPGLVLVVNEAAIMDVVPDNFEIGGEPVARDAVLALLAESPAEDRAMLIASLMAAKVKQDPLFIVEEFKRGNIRVYPDSAVFKAIRLLPLSLFKRVAGKAFDKLSDGAERVASAVN